MEWLSRNLRNPKANLFIFVRNGVHKWKLLRTENKNQAFFAVLRKWIVICFYNETFVIIYENIDRNFSLVYSPGAVLAAGTRVDLSSSADLADPPSIPDYWIFTGDCFQTDRSNFNVSFSIARSEVALLIDKIKETRFTLHHKLA